MLLEQFEKNVHQIDYLGGDNCSVNHKVAHILHVPFVGCASHRLNLAVKTYFSQNCIKNLIEKVNHLMVVMSRLKNAATLARYTNITPEIRNYTRWSSTYHMLTKYQTLVPIIQDNFGPEILECLPTALEHAQINSLVDRLKEIDKCTVELQSEENDVDLHFTRVMFDRK